MAKAKDNKADNGKIEEVAVSHDCFNGRVVLLENTSLDKKVEKRYLVFQERKDNFFGHPDYYTLDEAGIKTNEVLNDTMF